MLGKPGMMSRKNNVTYHTASTAIVTHYCCNPICPHIQHKHTYTLQTHSVGHKSQYILQILPHYIRAIAILVNVTKEHNLQLLMQAFMVTPELTSSVILKLIFANITSVFHNNFSSLPTITREQKLQCFCSPGFQKSLNVKVNKIKYWIFLQLG